MRKPFLIVFGVIFIMLGAMMLFLALRSGNDTAHTIIAPLALIGAGGLSISNARRKPKKW